MFCNYIKLHLIKPYNYFNKHMSNKYIDLIKRVINYEFDNQTTRVIVVGLLYPDDSNGKTRCWRKKRLTSERKRKEDGAVHCFQAITEQERSFFSLFSRLRLLYLLTEFFWSMTFDRK